MGILEYSARLYTTENISKISGIIRIQ